MTVQEAEPQKRRHSTASVEEIITQKFFYAGCSARWMLAQTTKEIEEDIQMYLDEAASENLSELFNFHLGPSYPVVKTHLFSSAPGTIGDFRVVHYQLVSERATQLLEQVVGRLGINNTLYTHVAKTNHPVLLPTLDDQS